jgi:hypothetical protein
VRRALEPPYSKLVTIQRQHGPIRLANVLKKQESPSKNEIGDPKALAKIRRETPLMPTEGHWQGCVGDG